MSNEQIYLYRRKGLSDYATCDRARYVELSQHKLFETMIAHTSPTAPVALVLDENVEFERWWMSTEILRHNKLTMAKAAWQARARLDNKDSE